MATVKEIEQAVQKLAPEELAAFRAWFAEFDGQLWDRQFERDASSGALDALAEEALKDLKDGRCTEL
ncbi:MAG TPA: hypothetical protein VH518_07160 [Tepidisphaeraceae bacterium]|jgi:hypothetical protein